MLTGKMTPILGMKTSSRPRIEWIASWAKDIHELGLSGLCTVYKCVVLGPWSFMSICGLKRRVIGIVFWRRHIPEPDIVKEILVIKDMARFAEAVILKKRRGIEEFGAVII